MSTPLRVITFHAENYKRLTAVEIKPNSDVVVVAGRNAQGKTSVLDAIYAVLKGAAASRETVQPIRDGQDTAIARLEIGDAAGNVHYIATRRWTKDDSGSLTVESGDHAKYPSPQSLLDGMLGTISLDPLQFVRMDAKKQLQTLLDALGDSLGFDPVKLDAERKGVYERRTEVGRKVTALEGQLAGYPAHDPSLPAEEVSSATLLAEAERASLQNARLDRAADAASAAQSAREAAEEAHRRAAVALAEAQQHEADVLAAYRALPERIDTTALREQLTNVEQTNARIRAQQHRTAVAEELSDRKAEQAQHTLMLEDIDRRKADGLAAAKFPVPGLGFNEDGVTLHGIPFSQASTAERVRVSTALAMSGSPTLRVMRIDGGEALDADSVQVIKELAAAHDYQVWLSKVSDDRSVGVYIEEGQVSA